MPSGYELDGIVARTATTTVWKARDVALDRAVAIKAAAITNVDVATRLRAEAAMLAKVDHPNIVRVYDCIDHAESVWLIEQWIDGAPLGVVLARTARLRAVDALALTRGALLGLAHAHGKRIVHGDVSPGNILVDGAGAPMLVDFGLAAAAGDSGVGGTPGYLSPEAARNEPLTPRSDVYSAAAVLVRLLRDKPAFAGATAREVIDRQLAGARDLAGIETPIVDVLRRALATDPEQRPADAARLLEQLEDAAERVHGAGWKATSGLGAVGGVASSIAAGLQIGGSATVVGGALGAAPAVTQVTGGGLMAKLASASAAGKIALAGVGAATVIAAGVGAYSAFAGDDGSTNPVDAAAESDPSAGLVGDYELVATVTSSNNVVGSGAGRQLRWSVQAAPICPGPGLPCTTNFTYPPGGDQRPSSLPPNAVATFSGNSWTSSYTHTALCRDKQTGQPNGGTATVKTTITLSLSSSGLSGTMHDETTSGDCTGTEDYTIVGTPIPQ